MHENMAGSATSHLSASEQMLLVLLRQESGAESSLSQPNIDTQPNIFLSDQIEDDEGWSCEYAHNRT